MPSLRSSLTFSRKIGQGHFGEVYLANDPVHGPVAVKVLVNNPVESAQDWATRKLGLLQEVQHLKQATHRNVVQVHNLLESDSGDAVLLVMDYCSGGSLQAEFDAGPVTLERLRNVATEVTLGLQALHARDMLHRDIKPGNLLINNEGVVQLGDFGLVTDDLVLGYGSQAGYWDHIAPEIYSGGGTSVKTDIWALGMTIYRLLHGAAWYSESPRPSRVVPDGRFADKLRWLPHAPKMWRRVLRRMLRDDPAERYQTATEVLAAISRLPISPDWICTLLGNEIHWQRSTGSRTINVCWQRHSARRHDWCAWSEPIGMGRRRTLGSSNGVIGKNLAEKQLRAFFEEKS